MNPAILILAVLLLLCGCGQEKSAPDELVEVKIITVHQHVSGWTDPFTNSLVERTDTHERIYLSAIYGQPGETVKIRITWGNTHWN